MSTNLGQATLDLRVDQKGLKSGMAEGKATVGRSLKDLQGQTDKIGKYAGVALLAIGAAAFKSMGAASDLAESMNKTTATFGKSAKLMPGYTGSVAKGLGMTRAQALDAAAGIGAMLIPMGKSQKEAAVMSSRMTTLAADLGSFHNQDPTEMLDRIRAGLSGESEPLKKFGINLSEARVKAEALRLGLVKGNETLTDAQKITARYSLIQRDAGAANGDFAKTAGGLANQQRILKAEVGDLAAALGAQLVPAGLAVVGVIRSMVDWLRQHQGVTTTVIAVVAALAAGMLALAAAVRAAALAQALLMGIKAHPVFAIIAAVVALVAVLVVLYQRSETVRKIVDAAFRGIKVAFDVVKAAIMTGVAALIRVWDSWGADIMRVVRATWGVLSALVGGYIKAVVSVVKAVIAAFQGDWGQAWNHLKAAAVAVVSGLATALKRILSELLPALAGLALRAGKGVAQALWQGILAGLKALAGLAGRAWTYISGAIASLAASALRGAQAVGRAVAQGVWDGIQGMAGWLKSKVSGLIGEVLGGIDIPFMSPPRHAAAEAIGKPLALGVADGVKGQLRNIADAIANTAKSALTTATKPAGKAAGVMGEKVATAMVAAINAGLERDFLTLGEEAAAKAAGITAAALERNRQALQDPLSRLDARDAARGQRRAMEDATDTSTAARDKLLEAQAALEVVRQDTLPGDNTPEWLAAQKDVADALRAFTRAEEDRQALVDARTRESWQRGLAALPAMAAGGIVTGPTLAWLGEAHRPEAVIPLDGGPEGWGRLAQAAAMMGRGRSPAEGALGGRAPGGLAGRGGPLVHVDALHVHDEMSEQAAAAKVGRAVWRELVVA